jgi:hypothetical protein
MKGLFITSEPLPMRRYIFFMALISLAGSLLVAGLLAVSGISDENVAHPITKLHYGGPIQDLLAIVVVGPIIETLVLSFGIFLLSRFVKTKAVIAILSAILWAALHSLASPSWGLVVLWPFFVFSCGYIAWRQKSWFKAVWVTSCIHALQNLLPALVLISMR